MHQNSQPDRETWIERQDKKLPEYTPDKVHLMIRQTVLYTFFFNDRDNKESIGRAVLREVNGKKEEDEWVKPKTDSIKVSRNVYNMKMIIH